MKSYKLGDVCDLSKGKTITRATANEGEIPVIGGGLGPTYFNDVANRKPPVITVSASGANAGFVNYWNIPIWASDCTTIVEKPNSPASIDYIYKYLQSRQEYINTELRRGSAQPHVYPSDIAELKIPVPSLEIQREIVLKLDKAFAEIDLLQVNLFDRESAIAEITAEKLDQIFRKKTEGASNSQQVALSEIARVINGRAYNQPELLKQGKYPVLRVGNFFSNRSWYYSDLELDKDKYCENGDLLYAWSASFGPRIWDGGKVIYHYHIWKVEEKKEMVLRDWLYWWFLWDVKQIKEAHGTGSTMMHVTKGAMENRVVQLPSLEMQSQQVREIAELQLATQKIESNYNDLAKKLLELKNAVLSSSFEEAVA